MDADINDLIKHSIAAVAMCYDTNIHDMDSLIEFLKLWVSDLEHYKKYEMNKEKSNQKSN